MATFTLADNYPGVIELVGYSNRRARTYYQPSEERPVAPSADSKMQADIETVKQNIEKYNKLLTLDTKNLPESQKDMLERIVERVARLKETLDINEKLLANSTQSKSADKHNEDDEEENSTLTPTDVTDAFAAEEEEEGKTEPTLVLDETTLLQLQNSMDKLAAAQAAVTTSQTGQIPEFPTTTEMNAETVGQDESAESSTDIPTASEDYDISTMESATEITDPQEDFVAARSNNVGITAAADESETMATLSTTIGSQRTLTTSGKTTKTRATKRPNGHTSTKGTGGKRRPSTSSYTKTSSTKQRITHAPSTVTQSSYQQKISHKPLSQPSLQSYQQAPPKPVSVSPSGLDKYTSSSSSTLTTSSYGGINPVNNMASLSASSSSASSAAATSVSTASTLPSNSYGSNNQDIVYDAHVNTSAIIDSLNNNGREEFYQQQQQQQAQQKQGLPTAITNKDKKPLNGAKPTKYHYYPHNQHIYLLPECAIQQVCNAVYVRLNYTQPLCACPSRYRDPCSASLNEDDQHTTKLVGDGKKKV
ncbi:serine-rich adhesin for platelets [Musca vetustissima]|uniref:serine-rich adhesin for platelets n=1 Tax=Musca vetustissima TaxID=27455 RepID=UPI002AB7E029|nr:serine-rich adhesin for platelets [Musca vetustissima]